MLPSWELSHIMIFLFSGWDMDLFPLVPGATIFPILGQFTRNSNNMVSSHIERPILKGLVLVASNIGSKQIFIYSDFFR